MTVTTAGAAVTPMQAGVTLILLAVFAYGVRETIIQIGPIRPSLNAGAAIGLCAVIGAMLFLGSWVAEGMTL
jgi:hypothetical protein